MIREKRPSGQLFFRAPKAPGKRRAGAGISVDTAVDIAKEVADIILLEKDLQVLEEGVIEGRRPALQPPGDAAVLPRLDGRPHGRLYRPRPGAQDRLYPDQQGVGLTRTAETQSQETEEKA